MRTKDWADTAKKAPSLSHKGMAGYLSDLLGYEADTQVVAATLRIYGHYLKTQEWEELKNKRVSERIAELDEDKKRLRAQLKGKK